jgi:hypothetical protein
MPQLIFIDGRMLSWRFFFENSHNSALFKLSVLHSQAGHVKLGRLNAVYFRKTAKGKTTNHVSSSGKKGKKGKKIKSVGNSGRFEDNLAVGQQKKIRNHNFV